ncbi:GNAT family N-acetyltransferase [Latilactobacillus sakei]|uniref:GNAT family N-acetyltransferase n=1 Tax=Latilactobacillus sakei TaxID=1599 RepID=UPI000DC641CF|nr:GNAT family N-acetyltransferase [Latilactobacillus sakei]SPS07069.1 Protease synthase and sporulation negative regulatory protein PAI 1 [Latilactobacillus sakei]
MSIEKVTSKQLKALQTISIQTFTDTFGADNSEQDLADYLDSAYNDTQLSSEIANPNSAFYFIKHNGNIAGYLKLNSNDAQTENPNPDSMEVERIYILPTFKRLGLGTQLIEYAIETAQEAHKSHIWLGVWEHNAVALAFYTKLGFKEIGDHIFQLGDDAQRDLIMQKDLNLH